MSVGAARARWIAIAALLAGLAVLAFPAARRPGRDVALAPTQAPALDGAWAPPPLRGSGPRPAARSPSPLGHEGAGLQKDGPATREPASASRIVGRVLAADGEALVESDVEASIRRPVPRGPGGQADERDEEIEAHVQRTQADGSFRFGDDGGLEPGTWEVTATPWRDGPVRASAVVEVGAGPAYVELRLPPTQPGDGVTVRLVDAEGADVAPSLVTLDLYDRNRGGCFGRVSWRRRSDGAIWVPTAFAPSSGGPWVDGVLCIHTRAGLRQLVVPAGVAGVERTVTLDRPSRVSIRIEPMPSWLDHASLRLEAPYPIDAVRFRVVGEAVIDREGLAAFGEVQPGTHRGTLSAVVDGWKVAWGLGDVHLRSGDHDDRLFLPPLYRTELLHGAGELWIQGVGPTRVVASWTSVPREPGSVRTPGLPAGEYEIRQGGKRVTTTLPTEVVILR